MSLMHSPLQSQERYEAWTMAAYRIHLEQKRYSPSTSASLQYGASHMRGPIRAYSAQAFLLTYQPQMSDGSLGLFGGQV
jgi:hypothetical protein